MKMTVRSDKETVLLITTVTTTLAAVVTLLINVAGIRAGSTMATRAAQAVPAVMSYQGLLLDPQTNQPVPDGAYELRFRIYDDPETGALRWEEAAAVSVAGGVFTHLLGSAEPLGPGVFGGGAAYLEVAIDGVTQAPRARIAAVAYAMVAETLDGQTLGDLDDRFVDAGGDHVAGDLTVAGNVGVGTTNPDHRLVVAGGVDIFESAAAGGDIAFIDFETAGSGHRDYRVGVTAGSPPPGYPPGAFFIADVRGNPTESTADVHGINFMVQNGDVSYNGALLGAFPRPAYDSGFSPVSKGGNKTFTHNLGREPKDYVVDMECGGPLYINNIGYGGYRDRVSNLEGADRRGAYWFNLAATEITVRREFDDLNCGNIRIRIWIVK